MAQTLAWSTCLCGPPSPKFLTVAETADELGLSVTEVMALVRRGDLPGERVQGHGAHPYRA
jgi:hypothetical protein